MRAKTALTSLLLSLCLTAGASAQSASREILVSRFGFLPSMAVTGDGNFVVAWQSSGSSGEDVFIQLFNGKGRPTSPVLTLANDFGDQLYPRVAADARGNFVVVWQGGSPSRPSGFPGGDGDGTGIFLQRFDRLGRRVGPARIVNQTLVGNQGTPDVAVSRDGSFLVAWVEARGIWAQGFTPSGLRKGQELAVDIEYPTGFSPIVAAVPEGFAVGWTETDACFPAGGGWLPKIERFTLAGRPVEPSFQLSNGNCDGSGWRLRGLASGDSGSVALFEGRRSSVQIFAPSGEPAVPRKVVGKREPCLAECENVLSVAMDNSGRFAVIWGLRLDVPSSSEGDRYPPRHTLLAQFFDPQGQPLGERFPVTGTLSRFEPTVAASLSDDGSLVVVWDRTAATPEKSGMFLRRFSID